MIEILTEKLKAFHNKEDQFNYLREYLQLLILRIMDERGFFRNLSFVGGTALRILFDLNRFSEDLDFCLVEKTQYDFAKFMEIIQKELRLENLSVEIKFKDKKNVASAFIKFNDLLYQLGLFPHKEKKLMVKFEVDQNPPNNFNTQISLVNKEFLLSINHFDLPSLFSGKLHALFCRKYTKGRDLYDFIWYLSKKIKPNFPLLNASFKQTENINPHFNEETLILVLKEKVEAIDFFRVKEDVAPFIIDQKELRFFDKDLLLSFIEQYKQNITK